MSEETPLSNVLPGHLGLSNLASRLRERIAEEGVEDRLRTRLVDGGFAWTADAVRDLKQTDTDESADVARVEILRDALKKIRDHHLAGSYFHEVLHRLNANVAETGDRFTNARVARMCDVDNGQVSRWNRRQTIPLLSTVLPVVVRQSLLEERPLYAGLKPGDIPCPVAVSISLDASADLFLYLLELWYFASKEPVPGEPAVNWSALEFRGAAKDWQDGAKTGLHPHELVLFLDVLWTELCSHTSPGIPDAVVHRDVFESLNEAKWVLNCAPRNIDSLQRVQYWRAQLQPLFIPWFVFKEVVSYDWFV